jgi:hypothetical protein
MSRSLYATDVSNATHEGATKYDISNPLLDLTFTKGAVLFQDGFYQSQQDEIKAFIDALLKAEGFEEGFGWKYGAYMRDPKHGKGNRIQGSVVPAVLAAKHPEAIDLVREYVVKCLSHRPDDLVSFVSHFENLGLCPIQDISVPVRESIAEALETFSDYQLLKYSKSQASRTETRKTVRKIKTEDDLVIQDGQTPKTLRLVDVMGLCRKQLSPRMKAIYKVLHSPTRERDVLMQQWPAFAMQRAAFKGKDLSIFNDQFGSAITLSIAQALSNFGNTKETWQSLLKDNMVPDLAFVLNIRNMAKAGFTPEDILTHAQNRKFHGIWPHQIYAGYKALKEGSTRKDFTAQPYPEYVDVFEELLVHTVKDSIPELRGLGFGDVSGSMSMSVSKMSSLDLMDISKVLCACVATTSGYAATFSDNGYIASVEGYKGPFDLVMNAPAMKKGLGSTQVYGAVMDTIQYIRKNDLEPFKILYFFSDMQFHPPATGGTSMWGKEHAPLELALKNWQEAFESDPPLVVLWNLSSYEGSPLMCDYPGVAMVSGYDANVFKHLKAWTENGGRSVTKSQVTGKDENMAELLDYIRGF